MTIESDQLNTLSSPRQTNNLQIPFLTLQIQSCITPGRISPSQKWDLTGLESAFGISHTTEIILPLY